LKDGVLTNLMRLNIFVYGTLKRGQRNHEHFCRDLASAQEATVRGWLYELPYGFPALVVPEADIFATGTTDYLVDTKTGHHKEVEPSEKSLGTTVHGELFSFDDPEERFPALDRLEGFRPGEKSFYKRVLIPATLPNTSETIPAWTYVIESASGIYLPNGRWLAT
jgi:gamma-glutamylcyclotransferase (GGCT)/AIG2-like uncharacterized protein YtfP